jgi:DHA2 family methylenomycin A resistance protein-like MFS transporter
VIEARTLGLDHPRVLGAFVTALSAGVAFVWVESNTRAPMLPLSVFRTPNFTPAVLYGITVNLTYYGTVFLLSLYLQRVRGYSALESGLAYLPLTATFFGINLLSGWLVARIGSRWPMVVGALVDAVGFALLWRLDASSSYAEMLPAFTLIPLGMGLGVPAMTTAVLSSADSQTAGTSAGVLNAARQAAGAIGVATFGALVGDDSAHFVAGMRSAATIAMALLVVAALVAHRGVRGGGRAR